MKASRLPNRFESGFSPREQEVSPWPHLTEGESEALTADGLVEVPWAEMWPLAPAQALRGRPTPLAQLPPPPPPPNSSVPSPLEEDFRGPGWGCQTASDECFFNPSPADLDDYSYLRQGRNARAWQPVTSGRRPLLACLGCPAPAEQEREGGETGSRGGKGGRRGTEEEENGEGGGQGEGRRG